MILPMSASRSARPPVTDMQNSGKASSTYVEMMENNQWAIMWLRVMGRFQTDGKGDQLWTFEIHRSLQATAYPLHGCTSLGCLFFPVTVVSGEVILVGAEFPAPESAQRSQLSSNKPHQTRWVSKNGYVSMSLKNHDHAFRSFEKKSGYCLMGSARNPAIAGAISNPIPRIPTTNPIVCRSSFSSPTAISVATVLVVEMIQFDMPRHALQTMATVNDVGQAKQNRKGSRQKQCYL